MIYCVSTPCNPIKKDEYIIDYNIKYKKLIDDLFTSESREITVIDSEIGAKDRKLLNEIIKEEIEEDYNIAYRIIETDNYDANYSKRGYYLDKIDSGRCIITIASGERSTGGYTIDLVKVVQDNKNVQMYVEERMPSDKDVVT